MQDVKHQFDASLKEVPKRDTIRILIGEEVLVFLSEKPVVSAWESLYQKCSWGTVFQSFNYISTWYQLYKATYQPILVIAQREEYIIGVLALAGSGRFIYGAGHKDAYYQTWLAEEHNKESFIKEALSLVMSYFPKHYILIEQMLPNTPLGWVAQQESHETYREIKQGHTREHMQQTARYKVGRLHHGRYAEGAHHVATVDHTLLQHLLHLSDEIKTSRHALSQHAHLLGR
jgi:hypothetical protein